MISGEGSLQRAERDACASSLANDLHAAINCDELLLQYQPKMHLRQQCVVGAEALIRWRHPVYGLILPSQFVPGVERTPAIVPLTLWTLQRALTDQKKLQSFGYSIKIFINIAGGLLSNDVFIKQACEMISREGGGRIGFEITETSVISDPKQSIANLHALADAGVSISIDDYGAGLSSLAYLKQLPAKELKIDKLFITNLASSHRDPLIVRSTIDLAHALEMEVVAEGVETQAALALLTVMGCDIAQGFLISRPLALDALRSFLGEMPLLAATPTIPAASLRSFAR